MPLRLALGCALALISAGVAAGAEFDDLLDRLGRERPQTRVIDKAGVFAEQERQELNARLEEFDRKTTVEIATVVLPDIGGGDIDDFSVHLFKLWGIGKKDKSNGVLLLAAIKERKVRIEVGYGLEPVLPDAVCGRIIDEAILPAFREQKLAEGLACGAQRVMDRISGQIAGQADPSSPPVEKLGPVGYLILFGFFGLVAFIIVLAYKRGWTSNSAGGGGFGGGRSGGGGASRGW